MRSRALEDETETDQADELPIRTRRNVYARAFRTQELSTNQSGRTMIVDFDLQAPQPTGRMPDAWRINDSRRRKHCMHLWAGCATGNFARCRRGAPLPLRPHRPGAGVDAMRRPGLRTRRRSEALEMAVAARRTRVRLCQAYLADCPASLDRASRVRATRPMPCDPRPCPESAGTRGPGLRRVRGPGTDAPLIPLHGRPAAGAGPFDRFEDQP